MFFRFKKMFISILAVLFLSLASSQAAPVEVNTTGLNPDQIRLNPVDVKDQNQATEPEWDQVCFLIVCVKRSD